MIIVMIIIVIRRGAVVYGDSKVSASVTVTSDEGRWSQTGACARDDHH